MTENKQDGELEYDSFFNAYFYNKDVKAICKRDKFGFTIIPLDEISSMLNTRPEPEEVSSEGKKFGGGPPFVCDHCKGCTEAFEQLQSQLEKAQERIKELEKRVKDQSRKILNFGGDALGLQRELAELKKEKDE